MAYICAVPIELIRNVTPYLQFSDVLALRLTCRTLYGKAPDDQFKARFTHRTTDMSRKSLEVLADIASHPVLGRLVQNITVLTSLYDESKLEEVLHAGTKQVFEYDESKLEEVLHVGTNQVVEYKGIMRCSGTVKCSQNEINETRRTLELIHTWKAEKDKTKADSLDLGLLVNIFGRLGSLSSLSLEAAVYHDGEKRLPAYAATNRNQQKEMWTLAAHDFSVVLSAIAKSQIAIEQMHVFGGEWGCSVLSEEVRSLLDTLSVPEQGAAISCWKNLTLNISPGSINSLGRRTDELQSTEETTDGFSQLLAAAIGLEQLDVRLYSTFQCDESYDLAFFHAMAWSIASQNLQYLTLRGFWVRKADLLDLLRKCGSLKKLELREIRLEEGEWREVFDWLREHSTGLQMLTIYRCYGDHVIYITHPNSSIEEDYYYGAQHARMFQLDGDQIRNGVEYKELTNRWKGSPSLRRYINNRELEYHLPF